MPVRGRTLWPLLCVLATVGCGALVWLTPSGSPERVAGALVLALVLPGAALSRLLFRADAGRSGGGVLLVLGLSLAVAILDSAFLYVVGVRLDTHDWTLSIGGVTLVLGLAGLLSDRPLRPPPARQARRPFVAVLGALLLAGGLLTAATLTTIAGVRAQDSADHFTALWMLPAPGAGAGVRVGVINHEPERGTYVLVVYVNGRIDRFLNASASPQGTWETTEALPSGNAYRLGDPGDDQPLLIGLPVRLAASAEQSELIKQSLVTLQGARPRVDVRKALASQGEDLVERGSERRWILWRDANRTLVPF